MKNKNVNIDREIADSFEQNDYDIPEIIQYIYGNDGFLVENPPSHPDHLWTILDRLHSDIYNGGKNQIT